MKSLTFSQITKLQKTYGYYELQENINSGLCWLLEGSYGRAAMDALESGLCMLPLKQRIDYYGNRVPSRNMLKPNTKGTFKNSQRFWTKFMNGDIDLIEPSMSDDDEQYLV